MNNEINEKENKKSKSTYLHFMGIGTQMIVVIILFTYLGVWLNEKFEMEKNYITAASALLGVFISFYLLFKQLPKE